jgi:hypothetical protein
MFGLSYNQCYGTDEEKNQPTHLRWEDMPGVVTNKKVAKDNGLVYHEPGFMSCRELMQFIGTEIFRKMSGNVWVDTTIRLIQAESPRLALIGDCRFPNEVEGIQKAGGKVIRFTRNPFPNDKHPSETALDKENFDWSRFDYVLDNEKMDINTQNNELYKVLNDMGMLQYTMEFNNATSAVG